MKKDNSICSLRYLWFIAKICGYHLRTSAENSACISSLIAAHAVRSVLAILPQKLLVRMRQGEDEDRANKERERNMCKLTLFGVHPVLRTTVSNAFHVHKDMVLEEATELGWKVRQPGEIVSVLSVQSLNCHLTELGCIVCDLVFVCLTNNDC